MKMLHPEKIWAMAKRDLIKILKGKSFAWVLLAQFIVISLTITSFSHFPRIFSQAQIPSTVLSVGVVGDYKFYTFLENSLNITLYPYPSLKEARDSYHRGYVDAVIFCQNFSSHNSEPILVEIYSPEGTTSSLLISRLKENLESKAAEMRENRLEKFPSQVKIPTLEETSSGGGIPVTVIYSLLLPLFFLSAVTLSGTLMINVLSIEMERKTLQDLLVSPITKLDLILSKFITPVLLAFLQISLWLALLNFGGFPVHNMLLLLLLAFSYSLIFVSLALISILISKERDVAQNIYTIFLIPTFLFLLPVPVSFIKSLGALVNFIPVFLITRLSFIPEISMELLGGFLVTGLVSISLFILSLKLSERQL